MRIWFIQVGEPLPLLNSQNRLWRTGLMAELFVEQGHSVLWWSSAWDHQQKKHYITETQKISIGENFYIFFIKSFGYKRNISMRRLAEHHAVAKKFSMLAVKESKPDVIIASYPTIEMCYEAVLYATHNNVPIIIDIRDKWPDLFYDVLPPIIRKSVKYLAFWLERKANYVFKHCTAITANGPEPVQWALTRGGRVGGAYDRYFPMAYKKNEFTESELVDALQFWEKKGIRKQNNDFIILYIGVVNCISRDLTTLVKAGVALSSMNKKIKIVICGKGEDVGRLEKLAGDNENIIFSGWINKFQIEAILMMTSVGVNPTRSMDNFQNGVTNKPIEYLSAGLPVVACITKGYLWNLLTEYHCGFGYIENDDASLASMIEQLYDNPELLQIAKTQARRLFDERFNSQQVYGSYLSMVDDLVMNRRKIVE